MQKRQGVASAGSRAARSTKARSVTKGDIFESDDKPYVDNIGVAPYF